MRACWAQKNDFPWKLLGWYDQHRRELPWRVPRNSCAAKKLDPYAVLVSEAMLQQTQVATVIPYYGRFIERFPTVEALAGAAEQEVLRLWQGLGYYSRARNLQRAAKRIANELRGEFPDTAETLRELPGVGRYTAGAVASIAFGCRAPILDGNVVRVLCRLDRIESDPRTKENQTKLWRRAEEILPAERCGDFNSALMELGATVCTPRNPRCLFCPVRDHCAAFAAGVQEKIPPAKKVKESPLERRVTFCVRSGDRYLIEQRPGKGRWAGMWQFITVAADDGRTAASLLKSAAPVACSKPKVLGRVTHVLTHRRYHFDVYLADARSTVAPSPARQSKAVRRGTQPCTVLPHVWVSLSDLSNYPLPKPHLRVIELLRNG